MSPSKQKSLSYWTASYLSWSYCAFFAEPRAVHVQKPHLRKNTIHSRKLSAAYSNQSVLQLQERFITAPYRGVRNDPLWSYLLHREWEREYTLEISNFVSICIKIYFKKGKKKRTKKWQSTFTQPGLLQRNRKYTVDYEPLSLNSCVLEASSRWKKKYICASGFFARGK